MKGLSQDLGRTALFFVLEEHSEGLLAKSGDIGRLWGKGSRRQEIAPGYQWTGPGMFPECCFLSPHVMPELGPAGYKEEQISAKLCPTQEKQSGRASWRRWGCSYSVMGEQLRFGKEYLGVPQKQAAGGALGQAGNQTRFKL